MSSKEGDPNTQIEASSSIKNKMYSIQRRGERNSVIIEQMFYNSGAVAGFFVGTGRMNAVVLSAIALSTACNYFSYKNRKTLYRVNRIIEKRYKKK